MKARVLIIGGYGNFGAYIAQSLSKEKDIQIIIGGRNAVKGRAFVDSFAAVRNRPEWCQMDYQDGFDQALEDICPDIVIHTSGPFQDQSYEVALSCIKARCHYIDLADARDFVVGISELNESAKKKDTLVVSGASSVPCLTAALIDRYMCEFKTLHEVDYGIATAQQTNRGLATTSAVLSYAGKPFTTLIDGVMRKVIGWQDLHFRTLPIVGRRTFANCDVPDLDLFPVRYPDLKTIRFYAGLEVPFIHLGLWALTWLVRWRIVKSLGSFAPPLLSASRLFDAMGSDVSAFYMDMLGRSETGEPKKISFNLVANSGDGPYIPCVPAIILAKKLARKEIPTTGAQPCVGLIDLTSYLAELDGLNIHWEDEHYNEGT